MGKVIATIMLLLSLCSCATLTPGTDKLVSRSELSITSLTWIKNVTDTVFFVGCSSGQFNEGWCSSYNTAAKVAQVALNTSENALNNYKQTGTAFNAELLEVAITDLMPILLKFDTVYKNPGAV